MLSDIKLWFRRWWARLRGYQFRSVPRSDFDLLRGYRQRRERGNVLLHLGKRRGKPWPTH